MSRFLPVLCGCACAALAAGAAGAQQTFPPHVDMPVGALFGSVQPANNDGSTVASNAIPELQPQAARTAEALDVAAQVADPAIPRADADPQARAIVNLPVFDTPETRRLYPPLSRAGRATLPLGN